MIYSDYYWLNADSRLFLSRGYLDNISAEDRVTQICKTAEKYLNLEGFAEKLESYVKKGWVSFSSPVWANYGLERGLPCSCNGSFVADRMDSILEKVAEIGMMTKNGAGTSIYLGDLRHRNSPISIGGVSTGAVHFAELYEVLTNIVSQSSVRRGSCVVTLPVEHKDIEEFLDIRTKGHAIQKLSFGVSITDKWMTDLLLGEKRNRKIWAKIIERKFESSYPYIFFVDTANNNAPKVYKDKNRKIYASNLCQEIFLHSSESESFVCVLSSVNLLHYDEWKNTDLIEVLTYFLDTVVTEYINKTEKIPFMGPANKFAKNERALGLGTLGWHSYLQSKMIPFESMEAKYKNNEIYSLIKSKTDQATKELASLYGEPELLKGYGERNTTRIALAPNTSSSFILGQVSQSIEPYDSNYFTEELSKGRFTKKNPFLEQLFITINRNTNDLWTDILNHGGSVQHLDFLTQEQKNVFKTFGEISQKEIVIQAAQRQKYIDQGQSLNLKVSTKTSPKEVSDLLIFGWQQGIKSFYYQHGENPNQQLNRSILTCESCSS